MVIPRFKLFVVGRLPMMPRYTAPALSGVYRENACSYANPFGVSLPPVVFTKAESPLTIRRSIRAAKAAATMVCCTFRRHTHEMGPWSDVAARKWRAVLSLLLRDEARGKM